MSTPTASRETIQRLHDAYCRFAGVGVKLRDDTLRLWWDLLKDYGNDEAKLADDLRIVLIHLRAQIGKEKRNPGAIKLANLLQPEQFESNLAEAKFLKGGKSKSAVKLIPPPDDWAEWLSENYPDAEKPRQFGDLPEAVQKECREALSQ